MIQNDGFSNSNFIKMLKKVEFHKYHVSRMMFEITCHFLIDSSNKMVPDLNNDFTGYDPNDDISSIVFTKSGEVSQTSKDGKLSKELK